MVKASVAGVARSTLRRRHEHEDDVDRLSRAIRARLSRQPVGARIDALSILQDLTASFPAVPMDEIWPVIKHQCKALGLNYRL